MNINKNKKLHRISRHKRVRAKIYGTLERPRVSVFKSNKHVFVQFIDDETGKTVLGGKLAKNFAHAEVLADKQEPRVKNKAKVTKVEKAMKIGEMFAEKAKEIRISKVVFDRGGFKYHGRIKAVADGLRKGGIKM